MVNCRSGEVGMPSIWKSLASNSISSTVRAKKPAVSADMENLPTPSVEIVPQVGWTTVSVSKDKLLEKKRRKKIEYYYYSIIIP